MNTNFDCKNCNSFCCVTPPMLHDEEEIMRARAKGARIVAVKADVGDGYHCSITKNDQGVCPFVSGNGCSIYEDRFTACREYTCLAKTRPMRLFFELDPHSMISVLTTAENALQKPALLPKSIIEKHQIEIVSTDDAVQLVLAADMQDAIGGLISIVAKNQHLLST